jgi:phage replisome organizer, putative, N-terminal region
MKGNDEDERRYVKIRTDMYDDIKMKIIDISPRRDLVHYVWSRTMVLAGKVNREGKLYMSKNIPYTIETLAIEFGRECDDVKLAFDLLIELEMVELMKDGIYIVKNFAKHQNIKVKEENENKSEHKEILRDKKEFEIGHVFPKENIVREKSEHEIQILDETLKVEEEEKKNLKEAEKKNVNSELVEKDTNSVAVEQATANNDSRINHQWISIPILLQEKKIDKKNKNKTIDKNKKKVFEISDMESQDNDEEDIISFYDGEFVLREGETIVREFKVN